MVLSTQLGSSELVSRVERLLSRADSPASKRARAATVGGLALFAAALACAGPDVSVVDRPDHIDVVIKSFQSEEDPDGWREYVPTAPVDRSEFAPEDFYCLVSLLEDGRVAVRFPKRNLDGDDEPSVSIASEVVLSGMNPIFFDDIFQTFKDSPSDTEVPIVIQVAASSESRAWLRLLEIFATRGEHAIAFQLKGERRIPASLTAGDSGGSEEVDPSVIEIDLSVLKAGKKVDVDSGDAWSGSGRFTFEGRKLLYTATSLAQSPDETGMSMSQGLAVDSVAGISHYLSSEKSKSPDLGARIHAGAGTVYGDVVPILDALLEAGFVDIVFLMSGPFRVPNAGSQSGF